MQSLTAEQRRLLLAHILQPTVPLGFRPARASPEGLPGLPPPLALASFASNASMAPSAGPGRVLEIALPSSTLLTLVRIQPPPPNAAAPILPTRRPVQEDARSPPFQILRQIGEGKHNGPYVDVLRLPNLPGPLTVWPKRFPFALHRLLEDEIRIIWETHG